LTSKQLVQAYIRRIKAVNPVVNGMHHDNFKTALELAKQIDTELDKMSATEKEDVSPICYEKFHIN
jgi:Asp-tRNA(Asn)/Glu-tRNA(Gln) amidotransferase A subunit family amidase